MLELFARNLRRRQRVVHVRVVHGDARDLVDAVLAVDRPVGFSAPALSAPAIMNGFITDPGSNRSVTPRSRRASASLSV